ncbi:peroxidase-like [Sitophilus oryzae]|uniref:Peroxidase-like n=1 Tax=Sitophilus oryzae TaxID=7048 RepID=A0A6J2XXR7_SITOR|nr:peroxidase-like [Sitophilus oryzae]
MSNERTRLLQPSQNQYILQSNVIKERTRRVEQFQCCICTSFIIIIITALVVAVSYINLSPEESNETLSNDNSNISTNNSIPSDLFLKLFEVLPWPIEDNSEPAKFILHSDLNESISEGQKYLQEKDASEEYNSPLKLNSPSFKHQKVMATNEKARNFSRKAYEFEGATRYFYNTHYNPSSINKICFTNITDPMLLDLCFVTISCNIFHKYRSYNGSCNNLNHPTTFGVAYRPFRRSLPPDYADGISKPRRSKTGESLPSARTVSLEVHRPYYRDDSKFSVMLAVWGQFLDHDITATALNQKKNGESISCCQNNTLPSECFPVVLPKDDPYSKHNVSCMEFVRSAPAPTCCLGAREQMNQATAFIDGSVVYGIDDSAVYSLRSMKNGLLKMYITKENRSLLPVSEDMNDGCNREEEKLKGRYCFLSGDSRANENLHLTSMHLIWARQHNNLASQLLIINPHWSDEVIFQESRRILGAQMQHITYNEFLPILLGENVMYKYQLSPEKYGYSYKYNPTMDPTIANVFSTSAFRFAHSLIPTLVKLLENKTSTPEYVRMHKMLFDPFKLYEDGELNKALKGAMYTNIEASDPYFSNEVKSHLFEEARSNTSHVCGLDLVSLNIQRGRDHALPGYIFWREHCGLMKTRSFDDLQGVMESSALQSIRAIYKNVEDIDVYTGALSEKPIRGTILGPTFTCLILDQFIRLKFGDRYWYENAKMPQGFSINQLNEIRKTTLAGIICDNADNLTTILPFVMKKTTKNNMEIACNRVPKPNLLLWKEQFTQINMYKQPISNYVKN